MKVEYYKHNLQTEDKEELMKVLDSLFLTTGKQVADFEKKFAAYMNTNFAVGVTSCTEALFLTLRYADIQPGDEVIIPAMTFLSTANVVEYCRAKPVLVDVEPTTGLLSIDNVKKAITPQSKCVIPVHLYGQMVEMEAFQELAQQHSLTIIEDACHAIEAVDGGYKPGAFSMGACFSFYATKNLTCGEGGAVITNDERFYQWLQMARLHGMSKGAADRYVHSFSHYDLEMLGFKCNMSNIQAALLLHQLDRLNTYWAKKNLIAAAYTDAFHNAAGIRLPLIRPHTVHAHHLYTIWVNPLHRDDIITQLQAAGVGCAVNYRALSRLSYYKNKYQYIQNDFPVAERIGDSTISMPFYPSLTEAEILYVIDHVIRITNKYPYV